MKESSIKACHFLAKPQQGFTKWPPIIVKFIYFGDKNDVWKRKRLLRDVSHPGNKMNINIAERLPQADRAIQEIASKEGLKTVTNNCGACACAKA